MVMLHLQLLCYSDYSLDTLLVCCNVRLNRFMLLGGCLDSLEVKTKVVLERKRRQQFIYETNKNMRTILNVNSSFWALILSMGGTHVIDRTALTAVRQMLM